MVLDRYMSIIRSSSKGAAIETQCPTLFFFFFFNEPAPTEIYPLPLHAALPICFEQALAQVGVPFQVRGTERFFRRAEVRQAMGMLRAAAAAPATAAAPAAAEVRHVLSGIRSEEHTSELQSQSNLVCRLLLEKKK